MEFIIETNLQMHYRRIKSHKVYSLLLLMLRRNFIQRRIMSIALAAIVTLPHTIFIRRSIEINEHFVLMPLYCHSNISNRYATDDY